MAKKKLASIRKGIDYQDLIAAEAILDMLKADAGAPVWIKLECREAGKFDDVVIRYPDREVRRQVKWAANPAAEPLTLGTFSSVTSSRKTPLIKGYCESWKMALEHEIECELEFITNRSFDADLQKLLTSSPSRIRTNLTKAQETSLETWRNLTELNRTNFKKFRRSISFHQHFGIEKQTEIVRAKLETLGGDEGDLLQLLKLIGKWSTDGNIEKITASFVLNAFKLATSVPDNTFNLAEKIADRNEFNNRLALEIHSCGCGYVIVLGKPGAGKSTAINTFDRSQNDFDLIVYNCYSGTSDNFLRTRARHGNFVNFLLKRLQELGLCNRLKSSPDELERILQIASANLTKRNQKLCVFIDGLDYAKRFASQNQPNLIDCLPPNLPQNIVFVVSAQVAEQLPDHLLEKSKGALHVPPLDVEKIKLLVAKYGFEKDGIVSRQTEDIAYQVKEISGGHALYVTYALKHLKAAAENGVLPDAAIENLPAFDEEVEEYYKSITSGSPSTLFRDSLKVMGACSFPLSFDEIARLIDPPSDRRSVEDAFREKMHLFDLAGGFIQFVHDSLRVFVAHNIGVSELSIEQQVEFLLSLSDDPRAGEHLPSLLAQSNQLEIAEVINFDWIVDHIVCGANIWQLHNGLKELALEFLSVGDWNQASRFWCLMACIEKAADNGELNETTMVRAWLDTNRLAIVERYMLHSSKYLSKVFPSDQAIDLLDEYGHSKLVDRLREKITVQSAPKGIMSPHDFEFEEYLRNIACSTEPDEVIRIIQNRRSATLEEYPDGDIPFGIPLRIGDYAKTVIEECLYHEDFDRVESWLHTDDSELTDEDHANLWIRFHLAKGDLAKCDSEPVEVALSFVKSRSLLVDAAKQGAHVELIAKAFDGFYLPRILATDQHLNRFADNQSLVIDFYQDVWLSEKLDMQERLSELKRKADSFPGRRAKVFLLLAFDVACHDASECADWQNPLATFANRLPEMNQHNWNSGELDLDIADAFARSLGRVVYPTFLKAKTTNQESNLESILNEKFLPSLSDGGYIYKSRLGIADHLLHAGICKNITRSLLEQTEENLLEGWEFKSGALISLAQRYRQLDDIESAKRVVRSGLVASFSYVYRKDTTINEFIDAFDAIAPLLKQEEFNNVAMFITKVLILIDELTDLRMLFDSGSYFVTLLSKHDAVLASKIAKTINEECRSMKCNNIGQAAVDEEVDITEFRIELKANAPDIEIKSGDKDANHRAYFITSGFTVFENLESLKEHCKNKVIDSSYCSAFWEFNGIIRSLISNGRQKEAHHVFQQFFAGVRILVSMYPLKELKL